MRKVSRTALIATAVASIAVAPIGASTGSWPDCFDPNNMTPISPDWDMRAIGTAIILAGIGVAGTVSWGPESPCGIPPGNDAEPLIGYLMLHTGAVGSTFTTEDDGVSISMGAPLAGNNWSFATIRVIDADGAVTDSKWAANAFSLSPLITASFRRIRAAATVDGGVTATLELRVIANAVRYTWTLTNNNATAVQIGLRHATWLGMNNNGEPALPLGLASGWNRNCYVYLPTGRPLLVERRFSRLTDPLNFPKSVDFFFRQTRTAPALRVYTGPDAAHPNQTQADQLDISNYTGGMSGTLWNFGILDDRGLGQTAFGLFFNPVSVPPGGSRTITYYLEIPFSANDLSLNMMFPPPDGGDGGYAVASEAPHTIAWNQITSSLQPNPFNIVCFVDNQYSWIGGPEPMQDVRLTLTLPPGLTFAPGEVAQKTIANLAPNGVTSRQWSVLADGNRPGRYTYTIQIAPGPGAQLPFQTKTISGTLLVSATPRQNWVTGPNLVTNPWVLANPNMAAATGLTTPGDFVAWNWDVLTQSYVPATNFVRGRGQWLVMNSDFPGHPYIGATPSGQDVPGGFAFTLRRGWNLIGNPYLYPVQLNQINATTSFNPNEIITWVGLTQRGWVRSTVFAWDTAESEYVFSSDPSQLLHAHVGVWVYVNTEATITLLWPPIFYPGLPGSPRVSNEWAVPTQNKWRVQFVLRGEGGSDASNYLGVAPDASTANNLSAPEPPSAPGAKLRLAFVRDASGNDPMFWAQDIRESGGTKTYRMQANVNQPGAYTITWPTITHMPNNLRARIVDRANNQSRDLRMASAYTFTMAEAGSRQFDVIVEPGSISRAVISNVMVSGSSRDPQSPITIQYSLSTAATVTTRILSNSGKEVFTMSRGRAENAGVNTVVWNKRMTDGTSVAPGNYLVEIVAETSDGQRVRVTRPVVVTR